MRPTFLGIGAQKCGTSSLYRYLRTHPEIGVSRQTEPAFFSDHNWHRGLEWYERQFPPGGDARAIGEISPTYAMWPVFQNVPERIAATLPDVKLLYLVRHPVRRMVSHYQHRYAAGREREPIDVALRRNADYLDFSRYAMQIERYLEYFDRGQLLVVVSERLLSARRETLREIYSFIGVNPEWWDDGLLTEQNVTAERRLQRGLVKRAVRSPWLGPRLEGMPRPAKLALRKLTHRRPPVVGASLSAETEEELSARLRDEVRRLRPYIASDFDGWGIG